MVARGRRFEEEAARYLRARGLRILARNVRFGAREVDLVALDGDTVCFVEVKGRSGVGAGHPLEAVTPRKRREVETVARWWVRTHPPARAYRFDVVSVEASGPGLPRWRIEHLPDAWRPGMA